ncbi:MAG: hypothetical protein F4216_11875 [Acidimicrobiaceae bacterium]|nr:hypothetical protein [Acidimicrobiaceae bacterium]
MSTALNIAPAGGASLLRLLPQQDRSLSVRNPHTKPHPAATAMNCPMGAMVSPGPPSDDPLQHTAVLSTLKPQV